MRKLPLPLTNFENLFHDCIKGKRQAVKSQLESCFPTINTLGNNYLKLAQKGDLYQLKPISTSRISENIKKECCNLYAERMVGQNKPGRLFYDEIILSAKGKCPFCQHRYPRTLDHYLPKTVHNGFPELSLNPINLVPCCRDCNSDKDTYQADNKNQQLLHPYFDDVSDLHWLMASVSYNEYNEPTVTYYVNPEINDQVLKDRIVFQFEKLGLAYLYSIEASNELASIEYMVRNFETDSGLKDHLKSEFISRNKVNTNSWQTAFYKCLSENVRFCSRDWAFS